MNWPMMSQMTRRSQVSPEGSASGAAKWRCQERARTERLVFGKAVRDLDARIEESRHQMHNPKSCSLPLRAGESVRPKLHGDARHRITPVGVTTGLLHRTSLKNIGRGRLQTGDGRRRLDDLADCLSRPGARNTIGAQQRPADFITGRIWILHQTDQHVPAVRSRLDLADRLGSRRRYCPYGGFGCETAGQENRYVVLAVRFGIVRELRQELHNDVLLRFLLSDCFLATVHSRRNSSRQRVVGRFQRGWIDWRRRRLRV